jgi:AcrR family transcriptional regulator
MARKSKAKPVTRRAPASDDRSERDRIIDAFMALLAEKPIEQIGLAEIAKGAGVSLSDLRGAFDSTLAILAAYVKRIDRAVLAGEDADMAEEPPRERLFDVLMRRIELLARTRPRALVDALTVRNPALPSPCRGWAALCSNGCSPPPTSAPPVARPRARRELRCCSHGAPGSTTTIPASPAPWRLTARSPAASVVRPARRALPDSSHAPHALAAALSGRCDEGVAV